MNFGSVFPTIPGYIVRWCVVSLAVIIFGHILLLEKIKFGGNIPKAFFKETTVLKSNTFYDRDLWTS